MSLRKQVLRLGATPTVLGAPHLWQEFMERFRPSGYRTAEEEAEKYAIFEENLMKLSDREEKMYRGGFDEQDNTAAKFSHLTPFADWTEKEFMAYQKLKMPESESELLPTGKIQSPRIDKSSPLPSSIDWRINESGNATHGVAVSAVKNQGSCGSCWAFSIIANLEGQYAIKTKNVSQLSELEIVECDKDDDGCGGGWPAVGMQWLINTSLPVATEEAYPYFVPETIWSDKCRYQRIYRKDNTTLKHTSLLKLINWQIIGLPMNLKNDELELAHALVKYGPLSVSIHANFMLQFYFGGILGREGDDYLCDGAHLNHAVTLVGYGEAKRRFSKKIDQFWTIRNSWGRMWGERGYFRFGRGRAVCGMNSYVITATEIEVLPKGAEEVLPQTSYI